MGDIKTIKRRISGFFSIKSNILVLSLLALYVVVGFVVLHGLIAGFKSLPSPIYGGDYYYQLGSVNHIRSQGNPLKSSSMLNGMPGYLPVYGVLCAGFANLFGLGSINAMLYFSLVVFVASVLIWFVVFNKIFKNLWLAAFSALIANSLNYFPVLKYTQFTRAIMLPLFLYALYSVYETKSIRNYVLLGLSYSLLSLSHTVAFVGATIIIALFAAVELYGLVCNKKNKGNNHAKKPKGLGLAAKIKPYVLRWSVFSLSAIPLVMLYWYRPLFVYHLHQANHLLEWNVSIDFSSFSEQVKFLFKSIRQTLFNFSSLFYSLVSIFSWVGIYYLYERRNDRLAKFSAVVISGSLIAVFSYFITVPLLKINLVPNYLSYFYLSLASLLLAALGIKYIMMFLRNRDKKYATYFLVVLFVAFGVFSVMLFNSGIRKNQWVGSAKSEIMPYYSSLHDFLDKNSDVNDVIASTKELSFAVNAVSGRKVLVNRWAQQNDPYNSFSDRDFAAAILFYGNDTAEKIKVIKNYNVKYLYWDYYWINSEIQVRDRKVAGFYDPLLMFYDSKYEEGLKRNNISYSVMDYWVDPSIRNVRKFKLIIITPENYFNATHPWKPDIDKYMRLVWRYSSNGRDIAKLYEFNASFGKLMG